MSRTATRVAAAVGATVVMIGLATPALACTNTDAGGRSAAVSSDQAMNDPGKAFHNDKQSSLTPAQRQAAIDAKIADKLAWLEAAKTKVSASDRSSADQKTAVLAKIASAEAALTQLRADVAAATSLDGLHAVLKAADLHSFMLWGWHHGRHAGGRHHGGGLRGDNGARNGGNDRSSGFSGGHVSGHSSGHQAGFQH